MVMNQDDEYIPINLWIAERSYRIKAKRSEEEAIRKAVKLADDKIVEMRRNFAGKDDQDFIAMCLLLYVTDQVTESDKLDPVSQSKIEQMIQDLDKLI